MRNCFERFDIPNVSVMKLLYLGIEIEKEQAIKESGEALVEKLVRSNFIIEDDLKLKSKNYVILIYQNLYIASEINPWYETCLNKNTEVYIGFDSLRLAENIFVDEGSTVLDLCSGTGIQGMVASRNASQVTCIEINETAYEISWFNIFLNKLEDKVEVKLGDLYNTVGEQRFDYIISNPPFIPMLNEYDYPICGDGGNTGLDILNKIVSGLDNHLSDNGKSVIFCQCLGNNNSVFFNNTISEIAHKKNWKVSTIIFDKMNLNLQSKSVAELTSLFNEDFDKEEFIKELNELYSSIGATNLYTLLYKIDKYGTPGFHILDITNPWNISDKAQIINNIQFTVDLDSFRILNGDTYIGYIDKEGIDIYNLLMQGYTLSEVTSFLYQKYKDRVRYSRYQEASYEMHLLDICLKMEQMGLIKRKVSGI